MTSAENSKAVFLLLFHSLFIVASMLLCVCVGGGMFGSCFVVHYVVSSFAIISLGKKVNWSLYLNCLLMALDS